MLATALITMILTPFISQAAVPLFTRWRKRRPRDPLASFNLPQGGLRDHVIVAGYGRIGHYAAAVMQQFGLEFIVIELDHRVVERAKAEGIPVIYGDATSDIVLEAAGVGRARLMLIVLASEVGVQMIAERVRHHNPGLHIVSRAAHLDQLRQLQSIGVHEAVQPEFEAGLEIVRQVLVHFNVGAGNIQQFTDTVRRELYRPIYQDDAHSQTVQQLRMFRNVNRLLETEWMSLPADSAVVGHAIGELGIRTRTGVSLVAVMQGETLVPNPGPEHIVTPHDVLAVLGTSEQRGLFHALIEQPEHQNLRDMVDGHVPG